MVGELNPDQMDLILRSNSVGRIGCHAGGRTYIVPISYAYDGIYIYGHTLEGMKVQMMRDNPEVCFEVDRIQDMANWQSVILWGSFEEIKNGEAEEALRYLDNRLKPYTTGETTLPKYGLDNIHFARNRAFKAVVFRIRVKQKTGRFEKLTLNR